jgi:aryl-phospho-beta-D-glucosidase BglC (GH1 family)
MERKIIMLRALFAVSLALTVLACNRGGTDPEPPPFQGDFPSAKALNARLGKGVNLGNALDAPKEGDWGVTLKEDYFRWIADSGFTMVRIPVRFSGHALAASPYTLDSAFLERVAWAVDKALEAKLLVVLDMHHYDAMMEKPQEERPRFLALWRQISRRFRGYPPELLFELLNEPRDKLDAAAWNDILAEAIDTIRVLQPGRTLVVGTTPWGGYGGLGVLSLPADSNLIVTVHYYEPLAFTHQGAPFVEGAAQWLGTPWRATPAQRAILDLNLEYIRAWGEEQDRPIFIGEFGSILKADSLSRAFYAEYLTRRFEASGFSWALWNFTSDFGIMKDSAETWQGYMVDALLHHGRNPALDSVLASATPIDTKVYVTFEDFEDSLPDLPASARLWRERKGIPLDSSHASWYVYHSDSSSVAAGDGTRIHPYWEVDSGAARNFDRLVGPWGDRGRGLHAQVRLRGGNYPWAGFGAGILGGWDGTFADLTPLTAIQFRARGHGEWVLQVVSDSVFRDTVENWGQMHFPFRPKDKWETFLIPAEILAPMRFSKQEKEHLTWEDVRKKVIALEFLHGQSYGKVADTTLELWIDDIRLIGVDEGDLGM